MGPAELTGSAAEFEENPVKQTRYYRGPMTLPHGWSTGLARVTPNVVSTLCCRGFAVVGHQLLAHPSSFQGVERVGV